MSHSLQMKVISDTETLLKSRAAWNALAGEHPFANWEWMSEWWNAFGGGNQLNVLVVQKPDGEWVGLLPTFVDTTRSRTQTLRFLSSGKAAADYLGVITRDPQFEAGVISQITEWIVRASVVAEKNVRIDLIDFEGVSSEDRLTAALIEKLAEYGMTHHQTEIEGCWEVEMKEDWPTFESQLSKSFRRKTKKAAKNRNLDGMEILCVETPDELKQVWREFIRLHQARRQALGQEGCFADERFEKFLHHASFSLAEQNRFALVMAKLHGDWLGAVMLISNSSTTFLYQSGFDPEMSRHEPGHLLVREAVLYCMRRGQQRFDFLRGDEPYKARWNTRRISLTRSRLVPARMTCQWKHQVWLAARSIKHWTHQVTGMGGMTAPQ